MDVNVELVGVASALATIVATFVRAEMTAKQNREGLFDVKKVISSQHADMKKDIDMNFRKTDAKIDVLFGQTRITEGDVRELRVKADQIERRTLRNEQHIDKIGDRLGLGHATP